MPQFNVDEFYQELEATQETYVRKKLAMGSYGSWKIKHVQNWLVAKDAERSHALAVQGARDVRMTAMWTMVGALGTIATVAIAALALWVHKT